jgi:hypothetical protein
MQIPLTYGFSSFVIVQVLKVILKCTSLPVSGKCSSVNCCESPSGCTVRAGTQIAVQL